MKELNDTMKKINIPEANKYAGERVQRNLKNLGSDIARFVEKGKVRMNYVLSVARQKQIDTTRWLNDVQENIEITNNEVRAL